MTRFVRVPAGTLSTDEGYGMGDSPVRRVLRKLSSIRSERYSAGLLLAAAGLALILANTGAGTVLLGIRAARLAVPFTGPDLSVGQWISDGLLAVFFFIIAVELRHELAVGQLNSWRKALAPAIAALGGVLVPAAIVLAFTVGTGYERGWPVPTATDIAFSLGILGVFGRGLPNRVRVFLMALAVLDDLIGILIIAVFFAHDTHPAFLALAAAAITVFGLLSRLRQARRWRAAAMIVLALVGWYFTTLSGVHPTIAGVALGAVMARRPAAVAARRLAPFSDGLCLPLFAFSAALVVFPAVGPLQLSPVFWGIVLGLVVGKPLGILLAGGLISYLARDRGDPFLSAGNLVLVGMLGGIGFTVSLLMNELAFARAPDVADEGTLAVLLGSGIAIVVSAALVAVRARHYRRLAARPR